MTQEQVKGITSVGSQSAFMKTALSVACPRNAAARYNFGGPGTCVGFADAGDSPRRHREGHFHRQKYTMRQLCDALDADFVGYEDLAQGSVTLPSSAPTMILPISGAVTRTTCTTRHPEAPQLRGGVLQPGGVSMSVFVPHGAVCPGPASGSRRASLWPMVSGRHRRRPTACFLTSTLWADQFLR